MPLLPDFLSVKTWFSTCTNTARHNLLHLYLSQKAASKENCREQAENFLPESVHNLMKYNKLHWWTMCSDAVPKRLNNPWRAGSPPVKKDKRSRLLFLAIAESSPAHQGKLLELPPFQRFWFQVWYPLVQGHHVGVMWFSGEERTGLCLQGDQSECPLCSRTKSNSRTKTPESQNSKPSNKLLMLWPRDQEASQVNAKRNRNFYPVMPWKYSACLSILVPQKKPALLSTLRANSLQQNKTFVKVRQTRTSSACAEHKQALYFGNVASYGE